MSEHQPLVVQTRAGSLSYCTGCERIALRYGPVLFSLQLDSFDDFVSFIERLVANHPFSSNPELRFRYSEICLCLNHDDAEALLSLLHQGQTEIWRQQLETQFQKVSP